MATEIASSIAVKGPGNATLNFRVYPGSWENASPTLSISVTAGGDRMFGHIHHLSRMTVRVHRPVCFLRPCSMGKL
jgi:hypothetical protein